MNIHAGASLRLDHAVKARPLDLPIRSATLHRQDLRQTGRLLAQGRLAGTTTVPSLDIRSHTAAIARAITETVSALSRAQEAGESVTPAAHWLLDNSYLVEEAIAEVRRDLPPRYYRQLPVTEATGIPRVLEIAWHYVAETDSAFAVDGFSAIVEGFQEVEQLRIGELWALPSALRFVLLENLRRLAVRVERARQLRLAANRVADRVAEASEEQFLEILEANSIHAADHGFATQLLHRLRDGSQASQRALAWLEEKLEAAGSDAEETILAEQASLSAGNVTTGNIIKALRLVDDIDWTLWFERVSQIDRLLREQTDFALLDFATRDSYRKAIEDLAKRSGREEIAVARSAVEIARDHALAHAGGEAGSGIDIGSVVIGAGRPDFERRIGYRVPAGLRLSRATRKVGWLAIALPILVFTIALMVASILALGHAEVPGWGIALLVALFALPASEAATGLFNSVVSLFVTPTRLPGYEFKAGVPAAARCLVAIPVILGSRDDVDEAAHRLEVHYLSNMSGAVHFALLSDWPDSPSEETARDREILAYGREKIAALNARYPTEGAARFYLLHRRRLFNASESAWMGWERKRGKLLELNALLREDADTTFLAPDMPLPKDVRYVMTVDADTRMTRDAVRRLVGKLEHPMNRPDIDPANGRIRSGYAILQPRVTASLTTGDEASFFQRAFSANRGMDPYVFAVSDIYQDLFGAGSFTGKGLYHIDALESALKGEIPENTVLSHDLLEGCLSSAALVSDVELVEDYPTRYLVDASRHHRWARGDWQLLPWIAGGRASRIGGLSRWKMLDNLRRSLVPVSWMMASIAGWTLLGFDQAAQWQALLVVTLFLSLTFSLVDAAVPQGGETTLRSHFAAFARDFSVSSAQVVLRLVLMAHHAWSMTDAILRTLYRLFVSRRNLLEWRTASHAHRTGARDLAGHYRAMAGTVPVAVAGVALPVFAGSSGALVGAFFALLWLGSPAVAWLVSRSAETEDRLKIDPREVTALRRIARRTWFYFETFVTPEHNMLPPDNFQELPEPVVAPRTSPTNIGMYLLSVVSARDFGWLSLGETIDRIERTLNTIDRMERHRGHLYNWYDTRSLEPLRPLYVSSVDSGNLAGHLVAVASACRIWAEAPAAHIQGDFEGILDTLGILEEALESLPDERRSLRPLRQRLKERIGGMRRAVNTIRSEPETAAIRTINLTIHASDIKGLAKSLHEETGSRESEDVSLWANRLDKCCQAHLADAHLEGSSVPALRRKLLSVGERARKLAFEMDFGFLFNEERKLLAIGYRIEDGNLDEACYDLLASEARLTSLFGIAKGDLPTEHWFRLGRPVTEVGFSAALVSWSGSMFEYLMPPLVMKEPAGGILNQSDKLVIRRQIAYGRAHGVPWGISEAAYNARDRQMTYQYKNFGVPGLGLKRGLGQEMVVAPYASLLAAQFLPHEALSNLARLEKLGAVGRYGFHDAVDFTAGRVPENAKAAVVRNFMAHHHGMSVVAVANAVFEGRMRDRFHADPVIEAAELLLQEKAPRDVPATPIRQEASERAEAPVMDERPDWRLVEDPIAAPRAVNLLSNGHYNVMVTAKGTGYSRADQVAVTRWNGDATEERTGTFIFLRDLSGGDWWSATAEPKRVRGETAAALFSDDKATFTKTVGTIRSELELIVLSEGNGEARRLTLHNDGEEECRIEVTSFAEIALADEAADSAHPAFSKMFVKTEITEDGTTIFAERRKRSDGDPSIALAHFVTDVTCLPRRVEAETDRRAFIGRGRSIADAAAFDPGARLSGSHGHVLDPVMALRTTIRVPAHKKVSLTFWTLVAANRSDVENEIDRHCCTDGFARQAMRAWTRSQVQTRHVGLSLAEAAGVQRLARHLLFPDPALRAKPDVIAERLGSQSLLWPMSISGDFPIFVLRINDTADIEAVASALRMQEYLRARGLLADLVIVNEQASSYVQDLQNAIDRLCENARLRGRELGPRQHIFAVRRDLVDSRSLATLMAAARVVVHARNGSILDQVERAELSVLAEIVEGKPGWRAPEAEIPVHRRTAAAAPVEAGDLTFWNGYGGFADEGRTYVVRLSGDRVTPQPWINVVANPDFGFHSSAEGASFTWSRNSRDFQITPWANDPVTNRPGELICIHDRETGAAFAPYACTLRDPTVVYEARHSRGLSRFSCRKGDIALELTQIVDAADPVKVQRLVIRNGGNVSRGLRVYAYVEWQLGTNRSRSAPFIVPGFDAETGVLTATNPYHTEFGDRVAFLAGDGEAPQVTASRAEFLGKSGSTAVPETVVAGLPLSGNVEAGHDPCGALAFDLELAAGETRAIHFVLGDAGSHGEANDLARRHLAADFDARLAENESRWEDFGKTLQVRSPDPAFDAMVNVWLPYQNLACRIRARSAFYQASGAYGFRDQLQDTLALLLNDPSLAREQILNAASRQFPEGDVQHWWLPRSGAGVRTRISDDVVWLAYGVARYVAVTGDRAILDTPLPFIEGPALEPGAHDAFFTPERSSETAPLYEHCARALDLALSRRSPRGIPLILGGDWNDGMNGVGVEGRGESVWLGWFLIDTLKNFAAVSRLCDKADHALRWEREAEDLGKALDAHAWDGAWYLRGTFDDGTPLGSHLSEECRIDSIAQSWAVISGGGGEERSATAIDSALSHLIDPDADILRLFTPPFEKTEKEPGYIKSYPPGVRENGGQYTHAATWMVVALARMGRNDDAYRLFSMLNPVNHARDEAAADRYRVEPYVVAADIYSGAKAGQGGWTWYTGSAGWLYRAAVEAILGIERRGDRLFVDPHLPGHWEECSVSLRVGGAEFEIDIRRGATASMEMNGRMCESLPIADGGRHRVTITIAGPSTSARILRFARKGAKS